jgi:hypothetical protein
MRGYMWRESRRRESHEERIIYDNVPEDGEKQLLRYGGWRDIFMGMEHNIC